MKRIGRKIFYEASTGNVILDTGERQGDVIETTIDEDFDMYAALQPYQREAVGVLQFPFGAWAEEFSKYTYSVNPLSRTINWGVPIGPSLEDTKGAKIAQLNDFCSRSITAGFRSSALGVEHTYPSDPEAQNNLQIVLRRLEIGEEQATAGAETAVLTYPFQTIDAGYLDHSLKQLKQVFADGVDAGTKHVMHFRELKVQVEAATTAEEVNAIQW